MKNDTHVMSTEYETKKPKFSSSLFEGRDLTELDFSLTN